MFADAQFYEPLSRYLPKRQDFYEKISHILPDDWQIQHHNIWWNCQKPNAIFPTQGWKIHISATPAHAPAILSTVVRVLITFKVPFKFVVDQTLLMMINGKRWSRSGAGKFITVYPTDTAQCGKLLENLHQATIGYWGPYILSDKRYKQSRIVHYRYGGILSNQRIDIDGKAVSIIRNLDGAYIDDIRTPYFQLPKGIKDPFATSELTVQDEDEDEQGTLKRGRYKIESSLTTSNSGGVYRAFDRRTSQTVIIKEARPYTNVSARGLDSIQLLKKEHRLLDLVSHLNIAPKPLDFFLDWEHAYLAEQNLDNYISLTAYLTKTYSLIPNTHPSLALSQEFYKKIQIIFVKIATLLKKLHALDIIFCDISPNNVMVLDQDNGDMTVKFIDFEAAYQKGVDLSTTLATPGFSPSNTSALDNVSKENDYYGFGGLLLFSLFPINTILGLNKPSLGKFLRAFELDFDLPKSISQLIINTLSEDKKQRPTPDKMIEILSVTHNPKLPVIKDNELDAVNLEDVIKKALDYIDSVADFKRYDRLYPADSTVFETNPLSLGYGACGIAHVMHKIRGHVDQKVLDWILAREIKSTAFSPGLFTGLSGIAWTLLDIGLKEEACAILKKTHNHHLLWKSTDLFNGVAGWGITQLRFFSVTQDAVYLNAAIEAGEFLLKNRKVNVDHNDRCYWITPDGISTGLGHGVAGTSLFLLYLYLATGKSKFLTAGNQGIKWILSQGTDDDIGGIAWPINDKNHNRAPYWRWGSSGIGRVLLRYWYVTGQTLYAETLEKIHISCHCKYTSFPGYFFGLAGISEFYLDMARVPRWEIKATAGVRRLLAGCLLFAIDRDAGIAFPGESLSRISCDFGTGSAGIALVMHRYHTRCGSSFMLDELIPEWSIRDKPA